jgi:chaperone required for assembly of F1-ATPase
MKRFWTTAEAAPADEAGHRVLLDGRPLTTPRRAPLIVPTAALAQGIADEWAAVGDVVQPGRLPLTGLANAAIDLVAPDPGPFAAGIARYAETDLLCYRAEHPAPLVRRQAAAWDPLLAGFAARNGVSFTVGAGIRFVEQPAATIAHVGARVAALPPFRLAALQPLVAIAGSAVIGLGVAEGWLDAETGFAAGALDDLFQAEQWGDDAEAAAALEARRDHFLAAARMLDLLR